MNREIKLRVRLKAKEDFGSMKQGEILTMTASVFDEKNGLAFWPIDKVWEFLTADQWTGLQDKSKVDIYEGDVVRILYTDWPSQTDHSISLEEYKKSISHIGVVAFNAPRFELKYNDAHYGESYNSLYYGAHGEIEVIGNIYQHPELLKSEK